MMKRLEWTADLDTGIEIIDEQHKRIVEYINQLYDAGLNNERDAVGDVLQATLDYTLSHFSFEEALMEEAGYEFVAIHKKLHALFVRRVRELHDRYKMGEEIADELQRLLGCWLIGHIRHDDASYVTAVRSQLLAITDEREESGWLARYLNRFFWHA